ncbi:MAG: MATE family efflux transporter [Candidatus Amulumruptor caecigallinarius]|nr:MATE family efflux transporter [Candidatus Amulumruptor caecigallinarius]
MISNLNFKTGKINKSILRLAVPAILNNITVPLLGICDTAVSGHLGSAAYIGAVAVGAMMLNVIFWLSGFLRAGTTALVSNAFGAGDMGVAVNVSKKAFVIVSAISGMLLLAYPFIGEFLIDIISPQDETRHLALQYYNICVWSVPAQLGVMVVSGWFIGMQNTVVPMFVAIGMNIVNIVMSLIYVFPMKMGFSGIALGTLTANWIGFATALLYMIAKIRKLPKNGGKVKWHRFFSVNSNLFMRSFCIMGVTMAVTSYGARLGDTVLAVNAVMMQFFIFFSYFMDGFAFAGEALVGKASGEKNIQRLHATTRALLLWGAGMASAFFIIYLFAGSHIAGLITDSADVCMGVAEMHLWVVLLPPVTVAAFLFDGIFIGLTRTRMLFLTTLLAAAIFFAITLPFDIKGGFNNNILWLAFECYLLIRGLSLAICYAHLGVRLTSHL